MKSSRPLFYQCRVLALTLIMLASVFARADESDIEEYSNASGKVEVQYEASMLAPYRQRRADWSPVLGINVYSFQPKKYYSSLDGNSFQDKFGSSATIPLVQAQIGTQYNFGLGSLGMSLDLGYGRISNGSTLQIIKVGGSATYTMNALWNEPYVAPYISGEVYAFNYQEDNGHAENTSPGTSFTLGLLFQLNWLDPQSSLDARNSSGLNNIFLDLFAQQYNTSSSSSDANFESELNWGAGLKFEF